MKRVLIEIVLILMTTEMWFWTGVLGGECNFCMQTDTLFGQAICDKTCNGSICTCYRSSDAACVKFNVLNLFSL